MVNAKKIKFSVLGLICSCCVLVFCTCSKESSIAEKVNSPVTDEFEAGPVKNMLATVFHKSVGGPIKKEQGNEWIENYKRKNGKSFTYTIQSDVLDAIINNLSCEGITFYHALDEKGNRHILPIGSTSSGRLIKTDYVSTQNGNIAWEVAVRMINNYPGETRSHFFGANTVKRLIRDEGAETVLITGALDVDNKTQLLLSDAKYLDTASFLDMSYPCPPHCNEDEEIVAK